MSTHSPADWANQLLDEAAPEPNPMLLVESDLKKITAGVQDHVNALNAALVERSIAARFRFIWTAHEWELSVIRGQQDPRKLATVHAAATKVIVFDVSGLEEVQVEIKDNRVAACVTLFLDLMSAAVNRFPKRAGG
jgi:hypothetical protein